MNYVFQAGLLALVFSLLWNTRPTLSREPARTSSDRVEQERYDSESGVAPCSPHESTIRGREHDRS